MKKSWFAIPALLAAAACNSLVEPTVCPAILPASLMVTVVDSVTSANITPGSVLVLRDSQGAVADSVTAPSEPVTVAGVGQDRTGTFSLTVRKSGYKPWSKSAIEVERGRCGAQTVPITAKLQPAG